MSPTRRHGTIFVKKAVFREIGTIKAPAMDHATSRLSAKLEIRKAAVESGAVTDCAVKDVIHGIGSKWVSLLMMALAERPHHFGELRRLLSDVSQRMLT